MPRGFRHGDYDAKVTKLLRANGLFADRRSKVVHDVRDEMHLLLFGADMGAQYRRVYEKSGRSLLGAVEMDHKKGGTSSRCDCQHNLQILTVEEHRRKHNRDPKFGPGRTELKTRRPERIRAGLTLDGTV